jgi:hypothetical protein
MNDWAIVTDPGCDRPEHRDEIAGAMIALHEVGPWPGKTDMDCGCTLELLPMSAASKLPRS